jgi:DDE superfamily endonuclease
MKSIAHVFLISSQSLSWIVRDTCDAVWRSLAKESFPKLTQEKFLRIAQGFEQKGKIPHCIGCIDGKHCQIYAFKNSGSKFFNYKKTFSLVLLAICDSDNRFIYVDIGAAGSESDGGIFRRSELGKKLFKNELPIPPPKHLPNSTISAPFIFCGDEAFPAHQNLLTPFPGRGTGCLSFEKSNYNGHFSNTRGEIEKSFGILMQKFQIFNRPIIASETTAKSIIKACVVLHNFLRPAEDDTHIEFSGVENQLTFSAKETRDIYARFYRNNVFRNYVETIN